MNTAEIIISFLHRIKWKMKFFFFDNAAFSDSLVPESHSLGKGAIKIKYFNILIAQKIL